MLAEDYYRQDADRAADREQREARDRFRDETPDFHQGQVNAAGELRKEIDAEAIINDYMPREGVNGFSLRGNAHQLVDAALQVYARTGMYPESRALHEAAMAYRAELIRIVSEHRVEHPI